MSPTLVPIVPIRGRGNLNYPPSLGIHPRIIEISLPKYPVNGRSSSKKLRDLFYSGHTDYMCENLWLNDQWPEEYANKIGNFLTKNGFKSENGHAPKLKIVEIHPPLKGNLDDYSKFLEYVKVFEGVLRKYVSYEFEILLENRNEEQGRENINEEEGDVSLVATSEDFVKLDRVIKENKNAGSFIDLGFIIDFPQLFESEGLTFRHDPDSSHNKKWFGIDSKTYYEKIEKIFSNLYEVRSNIKEIHLWGKCAKAKASQQPHSGGLNSYFAGSPCDDRHRNDISEEKLSMKNDFLDRLYNLLDDGRKRYFLPELTFGDKKDLVSIVKDLQDKKFIFEN